MTDQIQNQALARHTTYSNYICDTNPRYPSGLYTSKLHPHFFTGHICIGKVPFFVALCQNFVIEGLESNLQKSLCFFWQQTRQNYAGIFLTEEHDALW